MLLVCPVLNVDTLDITFCSVFLTLILLPKAEMDGSLRHALFVNLSVRGDCLFRFLFFFFLMIGPPPRSPLFPYPPPFRSFARARRFGRHAEELAHLTHRSRRELGVVVDFEEVDAVLHGHHLAAADGVGDPLVHARCAHRSEEHTSELQSQSNLVCRLLLEK